MIQEFKQTLQSQLQALQESGLYKSERLITTPQSADITVQSGQHVLNFCANNYLGLANHPDLIHAAQQALVDYGYGMASVRFICGTQKLHKDLERKISQFLGMDDTILYSSCFDANGGLFETLLTDKDAIISDELNHASIIDGIRLAKAQRFRYKNNNMQDLESKLQEADQLGCRFKLIATDGVFSMDGIIANLRGICELAERYDALVMVDDSHALGFMGEHGRGTPEYCGVEGKIDIITGTFGKALGGASGGFTAARAEIVEWLRQRSRPYLFSNSLAPVIAATTLKVIDMLLTGDELRKRLQRNSARMRQGLTQLGFNLVPGDHPIIPVMLGDAKLAQQVAAMLLEKGIYAIGFFYPVVPEGKARIRLQLSAGHTFEQIDRALAAFSDVGRALNIIPVQVRQSIDT